MKAMNLGSHILNLHCPMPTSNHDRTMLIWERKGANGSQLALQQLRCHEEKANVKDRWSGKDEGSSKDKGSDKVKGVEDRWCSDR